MAFIGPMLLGVLALVTDDEQVRHEALAEGGALLAAGSISHNHLMFRRDAIEACLAAGAWDDAERYATALADYASPEPMPWTDYISARGHALAAFGRGQRGAELFAQLGRLREQGEQLGLKRTLPAIEAALAEQPRGVP
jgi:hypothetical protein